MLSLFYKAISSDLIPCFFHCITSSWWYDASMFANSPHFHITVPLPKTTDLRSAHAVSAHPRRRRPPRRSPWVKHRPWGKCGWARFTRELSKWTYIESKKMPQGHKTNYTSKVLLERVSWILERETSIKLWWLIQGLYHTMNFIANAEFI